jgi:histidinol dehydrogenase
MKVIKYGEIEQDFFNYEEIEEIKTVKKIITDVKKNGDKALKKYTKQFDNVELDQITISGIEIENAYKKASKEELVAIKKAAENIKKFARKQKEQFNNFEFEIKKGVFTGQAIKPIKRVGVYVPGGNFPLASTLLMCAIPAQVAGVSEIAVSSPPTYQGTIHPLILSIAYILKITEIYKIGGAQAIAALAYGTETVKSVDKIVGPGNKYVQSAKKEVLGNVGIDFIAGQTEIMIIADETGNAKIIASDLLSQAEHDIDALPILGTTSERLAKSVLIEIEKQLNVLKTKEIAEQSITNKGKIILLNDIDEGIELANRRGPEHLEIQIRNSEKHKNKFNNYGSLFIGKESAEALGDFSSGLNHTLPTNTTSRYTGGLSVKDFLKIQTTLEVKENGLKEIGPIAEKLAEIEGLHAHGESIRKRYDSG